jgi:hypothetical protein
MRRFVEGIDRAQATLFPECLEDWICEDNPARAIDRIVIGSQPTREPHHLNIASSLPLKPPT